MRIEAIPAGVPVDAEPFVDAADGAPLRCCLRESTPGERIVLVSYRPPGGLGAYAEIGPVCEASLHSARLTASSRGN